MYFARKVVNVGEGHRRGEGLEAEMLDAARLRARREWRKSWKRGCLYGNSQ